MSYYEQPPLSILGVFKRGISLGWSCIAPLMLLYVAVALPGLVVSLSGVGHDPNPDLSAALLRAALDVFNVFLMTWTSAVAMIMLHNVATGAGRSFKRSLVAVLHRTGALLVLWMTTGLLVGIGLLLLVVPGVYIAVALSMVIFALIIERQGPLDSLSTSYRLVRGNWWHTAAILGLAVLAGAITYVGAVSAIVVTLIVMGGGAQSAPQEGGLVMLSIMFTIPVMLCVLQALITVLANGVIVSIYLNLHTRNARRNDEYAAEPA